MQTWVAPHVFAALALLVLAPTATAADHFDGLAEFDDPAIDLGDLYVWPTAGDHVAFALTIGPGLAAGESALYDPDVVYEIHIDDDGDSVANDSIVIQFGGHSNTGEVGVRVRGLPGDTAVLGPVEQVLEGSQGARVWAGLRDDPFFHDAQGWTTSRMTDTLALDPSRDTFAGTNTLAVVVEVPADALRGRTMRVWATAGRWPR